MAITRSAPADCSPRWYFYTSSGHGYGLDWCASAVQEAVLSLRALAAGCGTRGRIRPDGSDSVAAAQRVCVHGDSLVKPCGSRRIDSPRVRQRPANCDTWRTLQPMDDSRPLPNVGAPAVRALAEAGARTLDDVERIGLDHLAALHGVGPKAIRLLRAALEQ